MKVKLSLTLEVPYQVPTRHEMFERPRRRAQQACCTIVATRARNLESRICNLTVSNAARRDASGAAPPAGGPGPAARRRATRTARDWDQTLICVYPARHVYLSEYDVCQREFHDKADIRSVPTARLIKSRSTSTLAD